jgi:hypothetical protein
MGTLEISTYSPPCPLDIPLQGPLTEVRYAASAPLYKRATVLATVVLGVHIGAIVLFLHDKAPRQTRSANETIMVALLLQSFQPESPPLKVEPVLRKLTRLAVLSQPDVIDAPPAVTATALAITIPGSAQAAELPLCDELNTTVRSPNCKPSR